MKYKLKYQTRGKVESYIATTTSFISELGTRLFDEHELLSILENVTSEVLELAQTTTKGLTANPQCDIDDGASKSLIVYNTSGREVLSVWFERIYDRENKPQQTKF